MQGRVAGNSERGLNVAIATVRKKDWDASPSDPIMKRWLGRLRREARHLPGLPPCAVTSSDMLSGLPGSRRRSFGALT